MQGCDMVPWIRRSHIWPSATFKKPSLSFIWGISNSEIVSKTREQENWSHEVQPPAVAIGPRPVVHETGADKNGAVFASRLWRLERSHDDAGTRLVDAGSCSRRYVCRPYYLDIDPRAWQIEGGTSRGKKWKGTNSKNWKKSSLYNNQASSRVGRSFFSFASPA